MNKKSYYLLLFLYLVGVIVWLLTSSDPAVPTVTYSNKTIKIAIIDTGYRPPPADSTEPRLKLCPTGHYDLYTNTPTIGYTINHGSAVAAIIATILKDVDYCAIIYQVLDPGRNKAPTVFTAMALRMAATQSIVAINVSLVGPDPDLYEQVALIGAIKSGAVVFTASGNDNKNLDNRCESYPSCYNLPYVFPVGASDNNVTREQYSNYGSIVKTWYPGSLEWRGKRHTGTSLAAPRALADWVLHYSALHSAVTR